MPLSIHHARQTKHREARVKGAVWLAIGRRRDKTARVAQNVQSMTKRVGRNVRRVVVGLLLSGWTAGWGLVSVVGWAADISLLLYGGLTMVAGGMLGVGGAYMAGQRRLKGRAQTSLIARADLHQLMLTDGMATRLHLFDDAWVKLQASLDDPSLPHADRSAEVTAEIEDAQGTLFELARRHAVIRQELKQLGRYASSDLLEATRGEKQAELDRIEADADSLVRETKTLAQTADQVRALATGGTTETTTRLRDAVAQFNHTLAAYREIEDQISKHTNPSAAVKKLPKPQSQQM